MYYCCFPIYYYTRTTIDTITIDNCYCVLLNYHYFIILQKKFSHSSYSFSLPVANVIISECVENEREKVLRIILSRYLNRRVA